MSRQVHDCAIYRKMFYYPPGGSLPRSLIIPIFREVYFSEYKRQIGLLTLNLFTIEPKNSYVLRLMQFPLFISRSAV